MPQATRGDVSIFRGCAGINSRRLSKNCQAAVSVCGSINGENLSWLLAGGAHALDSNGSEIFAEDALLMRADRDQEKQVRAAA